MHDLTYANMILERVKKEAGGKRNVKHASVDVYLNSFGHVTPKRLKETLKLLVDQEGFTDISLNVHPLEFSAHCKKCFHKWKSAKATFKCPKCGSAEFDLEKWEEFYIGSVVFGN